MSPRMAWRTAGSVGLRRAPVYFFLRLAVFELASTEGTHRGDHRHERMMMQALPGNRTLKVVENNGPPSAR